MEIQPGARVRARTARGDWVLLRATATQEPGIDFPTVWLCTEEDWKSGDTSGSRQWPWPVEDVTIHSEGHGK